ncbi:hypothetical protein [Urbifossiella limnaea]|uniref:Uncharacterized protein n=1 Tax=Urbifossiella limnaea TaxID=2528023 RepID=A0A517XNU3_9BACT|nr:hypothetical protein [Urbifossiella limnaea]QDU19168.1 hypothetical protein ETAA1_10720 [Urbifossiella limnaea]
MTRFRPFVESLDSRTLPSAVFATSDEPVGVVVVARETTPAKPPAKPPTTPYIPVVLTDVLVSSYQ